MNKASAYAALAEELSRWQMMSVDQLVELIGREPTRMEIELPEGSVQLEVTVHWRDHKHRVLAVRAIAYGPAHWHTERLQEECTVPVQF